MLCVRAIPFLLTCAVFAGCTGRSVPGSVDVDLDGFVDSVDCDDTDPAVGDAAVWFADQDGDGLGGQTTVTQCTPPPNFTASGGDCDDTEAAIHPGAQERCNDADDDCDGVVDNGAEPRDWFYDADGDGYGDGSIAPIRWCSALPGFADNGSDCDDRASWVHPGAQETCSGQDDDCDGLVDDADPGMAGAALWYLDADEDGFGVDTEEVVSCTPIPGYARDAGDCDDADGMVHPEAVDTCDDGLDQDCDGIIDNTHLPVTWYRDADGDGYGDPNEAEVVGECGSRAGWSVNPHDCNDTQATVNPAVDEVCNGIDDDCNGLVDDDDPAIAGLSPWYADEDADGLGDSGAVVWSCSNPGSFAANEDDCDDSDSAVGAALPWYLDADSDSYGAGDAVLRCFAGADETDRGGDCDDGDPGAHPGAVELCADGIDQDCNGVVDDSAQASTFYADSDADGWGDPATAEAVHTCAPPAGMVANDEDCDDDDPLVSPAGIERCGGGDEDCDGLVDDDDTWAAARGWFHRDADADGFGRLETARFCVMPAGYVVDATDCDDGLGSVNPAAVEVCNGIDDDCDGAADDADPGLLGAGTYYADADSDGYGDPAASATACQAPVGHVSTATDCDDGAAAVHPGAAEVCNSADDDCDGLTDDADPGVTGGTVWYADADADGDGDAMDTTTACLWPAGTSDNALDCNDADDQVFDGSVCSDGLGCTVEDRCGGATCDGVPDGCGGCGNDCGAAGSGQCCEQSCSGGSCPTCAAGAACALECSGVGSCDAECEPGSACGIEVSSADDGNAVCDGTSPCLLFCNGVGTCALDCVNGSFCDVFCNSVDTCDIVIDSASMGVVECNSTENCDVSCDSPASCPGGETVCNGALCP